MTIAIAEPVPDQDPGTPKAPKRSKRQRRPRAPGEVIRLVSFKQTTWPLDDAMIAAMQPGLVLKVELVIRVEDVAEYPTQKTAWVVSVLEIGQLHE